MRGGQQDVRLLLKYRKTSAARQIDLISLDEDLKVFALSEIKVAGKPRLPTNLQNANKNVSTFRETVSFKWIAQVEAQVSKQMYTLEVASAFLDSRTYKGPAKSNPVWVKGGLSDTLNSGRSGEGCRW